MKKTNIIILSIILLSFIINIYFYPKLPDQIASHWNAQGQVDGYMPKLFGLFIFPLISIILFLLFNLIPKIDPLKHNIKKFRKYYEYFIILILLFLFYIDILIVFWNLNFKFSIIQFLIPALSILFYYLGILMENSKRNWFIGIRTPWTLSSESVWLKTHQVAGKLFKIGSIIFLIGIFFKNYALFFIFIPITLIILYVVVYSYVEYQKQIK